MSEDKCSEGCDRPVRTRGLCGACYTRFLRSGLTLPMLPPLVARQCSDSGCVRIARGKCGLCSLHYQRMRRNGHTGPRTDRLCSIVGCGRKHRGQGYCHAHLKRFSKYGSPLDGGTYVGEPKKFLEDHVGYEGAGCLNWPFATTDKGYGQVVIDGKKIGAHRYMCILKYGPPPFDGAEAAHSCGKGHEGCFHPLHVRWADHSTNIMDRVAHGTHNRGEVHPNVKLTRAQARMIAFDGRSWAELAVECGVSESAIQKVKEGTSWSWLTGIKPKTTKPTLSPEQVLTITEDQREHGEIAATYGCCKETVRNIFEGHTWSWLTGIKPKTPKPKRRKD